MHYDIIGDIHGQADKLEELLQMLGYTENGIGYAHQQNQSTAVFVGDLIDRGKQNHRVIEIVRSMEKAGNAHIVMGNHEYNAIRFHTRTSGNTYLRPHTKERLRQHQNFLAEYPLGASETEEVIEWFKTLPLFLDLKYFRVIHACWEQQTILSLQPYLRADNSLPMQSLESSAKQNSSFNPGALFKGIECLLKGKEIPLPQGSFFWDKDGTKRNNIRVRWWHETLDEPSTYRNLALGYREELLHIPGQKVPASRPLLFYDDTAKPVFFGHYWMTGHPSLQRHNVCCLDYSAGKKEKLVAYHFNTEEMSETLLEQNFRVVVW